jgi:aminoglycoside 6'-N-acetyltransferase
MASTYLIQSGDLSIRWLLDNQEEYRLLSRWLTDPRVLEWYEGRDNPFDVHKVEEQFGPLAQGRDRVKACIVLYRDIPVGYVQYYPLSQEEGRSYTVTDIDGVFGTDIFLGEPELWNRGLGTKVMSLLLDYIRESFNALSVVIDPQVSNLRAIRCYEKVGFKKVRILPKHEWHEGKFRDCWLMTFRWG